MGTVPAIETGVTRKSGGKAKGRRPDSPWHHHSLPGVT